MTTRSRVANMKPIRSWDLTQMLGDLKYTIFPMAGVRFQAQLYASDIQPFWD